MTTFALSVTGQQPWALADDGSGNAYFSQISGSGAAGYDLSEPRTYAFATSLWSSQLKDATDIVQRLVADIPAATGSWAMLKFFGTPKSQPYAAPPPAVRAKTYMGQGAIWGVSRLFKPAAGEDPAVTEYLGEFLGRFDLTVGTEQTTGSAIVPQGKDTGGQDVDASLGRRATVLIDRAMFPNIRPVGFALAAGNNASPALLLDTLGYEHLIVELRCVTPDAAKGGGGSTDGEPLVNAGFMIRYG